MTCLLSAVRRRNHVVGRCRVSVAAQPISGSPNDKGLSWRLPKIALTPALAQPHPPFVPPRNTLNRAQSPHLPTSTLSPEGAPARSVSAA